MELQQFTSLPFSISTLAKRAIKTNLGIPPLPGSATGFSESLISFECNPKEKKKIYIYIYIYIYQNSSDQKGVCSSTEGKKRII